MFNYTNIDENGGMTMNIDISKYFPIYKELTPSEKALVDSTIFERTVKKGTLVYNGETDCLGLTLIISGQLRVFMHSEEGREITLFRLLDHDLCLFSASCTMQSFQTDLVITAEKDSTLLIIPTKTYEELSKSSLSLVTYANEIMATHFTDVMWLLEQIMWKSFDKRLASFLIEESALEDSLTLKITHELIANHLGTAREVVTRMLKYFQSEGYVCLTRGTIEITDYDSLNTLIE